MRKIRARRGVKLQKKKTKWDCGDREQVGKNEWEKDGVKMKKKRKKMIRGRNEKGRKD